MTIEKMLSQIGMGTKQFAERYAENVSPGHDPHVYYAYEPSSPPHISSSKHAGGHKNNAAMSALTLLAFLFFLHILQQCLREHMTAMNTPQVMIMTAGRESEKDINSKMSNNHKIDRIEETASDHEIDSKLNRVSVKEQNKINKNINEKDKPFNDDNDAILMKINTAENYATNGMQKYYKHIFNKEENEHKSPEFIRVMVDD